MSRLSSHIRLPRVILYVVLIALAALWLLPPLIVINGAVHSGAGTFSLLPTSFTFENIKAVWEETNLPRLFGNSFILTSVSTIGVLVISSLAGYGFAQHRFRGSNVLLLVLLSGIMLAPAAIIVPLYDSILRFGLLNSYWSLIGPYTAFGVPVGILLFRNAFMSLPRELAEAARVDGASAFRIYLRVFLPLTRPVAATVAILQILLAWNDYLLALLFMTKEEMQTIQLAFINFTAQYFSSQEKQFAVMALAMLPVLLAFVIFQRAFIRGLTAGAIEK